MSSTCASFSDQEQVSQKPPCNSGMASVFLNKLVTIRERNYWDLLRLIKIQPRGEEVSAALENTFPDI